MITEIHVTGDELNALNKKVGGIHMPKPQTNEEWLKSLNTEDFAKAITNIEKLAKIEQIEWWLKQPHNNE